MKIYIIIVSILASIAISCENDQGSSEKVNLPFVLRNLEQLNYYSVQNLSKLADLENANFALITYLKTENINNIHKLPPAVNSGAIAIIDEMYNAKNIYVNSDTLSMTTPLVFPGYYFSGKKWVNDNYTYNSTAEWKVVMNNSIYNVNSLFQKSIYPISITGEDTINLNDSLQLNWTTDSNGSNRVYISFTWYPSYNDAKYYKNYPGFDVADNGKYVVNKEALTVLNIPQYGVLQANIMRYNTKFEQNQDKNILLINVVESSVSIHIGKD